MKTRATWTFEPDRDVRSLVSKAMNRIVGRKGGRRGLLTRLLNEAVRGHFASLAGKRELPA